MNQWLATVGVGAALCLGAGELLAQDSNSDKKGGGRQDRGGRGGPPDAAQMQQWQQQRMDRYKEQLEITDDAEVEGHSAADSEGDGRADGYGSL